MALVNPNGLDYFENGEPLSAVSTLSTAGVDYFQSGEWLAVAVAASGSPPATKAPPPWPPAYRLQPLLGR